jgi:hypothetical protein
VSYREVRPGPDLSGIVECYWFLEEPAGALEAGDPVLPDGCIEMVFHLDGRFRSGFDRGRAQPEALVVGQLTRPFHLVASDPVRTFGVRFRPGAARSLLPMPLHLLTDREEALEGLLGASGAALARRVRSADCDGERIAAVERALLPGASSPAVRAAVEIIIRRRGALRPGELRGLGLCDRHLRRLFRDAVGIGPKALCRIVRLRAAFAARQSGVAWAQAAVQAGFCDQAHLAREARAILGAPPSELDAHGPLAAVFGVAAPLDLAT